MAGKLDREHSAFMRHIYSQDCLTPDVLDEAANHYHTIILRTNGSKGRLERELRDGLRELYQKDPEKGKHVLTNKKEFDISQRNDLDCRIAFYGTVQPPTWIKRDDCFIPPSGIAHAKKLLKENTLQGHLTKAYAAKPGTPVILSAKIQLGDLLEALDAVEDPELDAESKLVAEEMLEHFGKIYARRGIITAGHAGYRRRSALITDYRGAPKEFQFTSEERTMPRGSIGWLAPSQSGRTPLADAESTLEGMTGIQGVGRFNQLTQRLTKRDARAYRLDLPDEAQEDVEVQEVNSEDTEVIEERVVWVGGDDFYGNFGVSADGGFVNRGPALGGWRERSEPQRKKNSP